MRMSKKLSHYDAFITINNFVVVPTPVLEASWTTHRHVTNDMNLKEDRIHTDGTYVKAWSSVLQNQLYLYWIALSVLTVLPKRPVRIIFHWSSDTIVGNLN